MQGKRLPTIEGFARIEMTEDVISSCRLSESRFVLGTISGNLLIYEADTPLGRAELESAIISVIASGENVIAASSTGQIQAFHGQPLWVTEFESGIENLAPLGDAICFCDASGMLVVISPEGETLSSQSHGDITQLTGSDDGSSIAIAMTDGTLRICSKSGEILQESSADSDDVETISQICFRPDGVLLVCRDSLGMTLDDRPENRLECWH
ncbi:MAG: hypothetical protein VX482_03015, partial [Candidatus Thermoplasmatota archaeon]|nr:hypothetical protein [Candidatus Thermoplasmatota archaeon]